MLLQVSSGRWSCIIYLVCVLTILSGVIASLNEQQNHRAEDENDRELTNYQLQRLVQENVLRKADISKLPCVRRNRRCLVESIKDRGWKNQQKLNKILNTILKIDNEKKFIDQAVKLMIEDNSELLKGSKNDEEIIAKYNTKGKKRTQKKNDKHAKTKKSIVLGDLEFLNTDFEANDFSEQHMFDNGHVIREENAELASLFSPEEKEYVENMGDENTKRSFIAGFYQTPNAEDFFDSMEEGNFGNNFNPFAKKRTMKYSSEFGNGANFVYNQQLGWQQNPNANLYQNNGMYGNQYYGQEGMNFANDAQFYAGGVSDGRSFSRDSIGSISYNTFNIKTPNSWNNYEQFNDKTTTKRTYKTPKTSIGESATEKSINITAKLNKPKAFNDEQGKKRDSQFTLPYSFPQVASTVPMNQERSEALTKLKTEAMENMMKMANLNITVKKPTRKLTAYEKARLLHRKRQEKFKRLYQTDKALYSGMNELNTEDENDLQESIKNLELGWDLDLDENKKESESDDENDDETAEDELNDESLKVNSDEQEATSPNVSNVPINKNHISTKITVGNQTKNNTTTTVSDHKAQKIIPLFTNHGKSKNHSELSPESAAVKGSIGSNMIPDSFPTRKVHLRYPLLGGVKTGKRKKHSTNSKKKDVKPKAFAKVNTTGQPDVIDNSGPTIANQHVRPTTGLTVSAGSVKASRVCKPGVMKTYFEGKPNCLIIGDSIALGYSYSAAAALNGSCQVQLAPASKAGAAMDTGYGKQCLDYFLSTISLQPTEYDVILFNFGLHDIDYLDKYPEEAHDLNEYVDNLKTIKQRLLDTGATVGFVLSTPVTYDKNKDDLIRKYNHAAKRVMEEGDDKVMTINLHKIVTKECGSVPFENCYMMKKPHDVHYGVTGSIMLGKRVASAITYLLKKRRLQRSWTALTPSSVDLATNKTLCALPGTACPGDAVCMENIVSRSGHACCQLQGGVDCGDSWHCCPAGTACHPQCTDTQCSCITKPSANASSFPQAFR